MVWFNKRRTKIVSPLEGYDQWASSYLGEGNPVKKLSDDVVSNLLPELEGKRLLDAGCGPGKFCAYAEQKNAKEITGLDLSPKMIEQAQSNCPSGVFTCADLSTASFQENQFDVIICALVLGHLPDITRPLDCLLHSLDREGSLIITDFHPFLTLMRQKRTFRNPLSGKVLEVRHYLHLFEEYFAALGRHDVAVKDFVEPFYNGMPAVFGIRVKKL